MLDSLEADLGDFYVQEERESIAIV